MQSQYHSYCPIEWGDAASEQNCWLGDTKVTLPDVNTQNPGVLSAYTTWIKALVKEFKIDGLRIDGECAGTPDARRTLTHAPTFSPAKLQSELNRH